MYIKIELWLIPTILIIGHMKASFKLNIGTLKSSVLCTATVQQRQKIETTFFWIVSKKINKKNTFKQVIVLVVSIPHFIDLVASDQQTIHNF